MSWGGKQGKGSKSDDKGWDCVCGPKGKGNWWSKTHCRACFLPVQQALSLGKSKSKGAGKYLQDDGKSSAEDAAIQEIKKEIAALKSTEKTMMALGWQESQLTTIRDKLKELKLAANGGVEPTREEMVASLLQRKSHLIAQKKKFKSQISTYSEMLREQYAQLQKAVGNLDGINQELKSQGWNCMDANSEDEGPSELQEMLERQHMQAEHARKGKGKGKRSAQETEWPFDEEEEEWQPGWQPGVQMDLREGMEPREPGEAGDWLGAEGTDDVFGEHY
jgi:myosin heavy subunit